MNFSEFNKKHKTTSKKKKHSFVVDWLSPLIM